MEHLFVSSIYKYKGLIISIINKYCKDESYYEDLFQDIACRAWASFHTVEGNNLKQWFGRVARNTAIDRLRRLKTQPVFINNIIYEIIYEPYIEQKIPVVDSLSSIEQKTLFLYIEGLSYKEISEITHEPTKRIAVRMYRIKQQLHKYIKSTNKPY